MPSHISRLYSVLSPLGLSTPTCVLISLSQIIFTEILLLDVEAVVLAEGPGARLKLFLRIQSPCSAHQPRDLSFLHWFYLLVSLIHRFSELFA